MACNAPSRQLDWLRYTFPRDLTQVSNHINFCNRVLKRPVIKCLEEMRKTALMMRRVTPVTLSDVSDKVSWVLGSLGKGGEEPCVTGLQLLKNSCKDSQIR